HSYITTEKENGFSLKKNVNSLPKTECISSKDLIQKAILHKEKPVALAVKVISLNLKTKIMTEKNIRINEEDIKELVKPMGYCYASDKITVEGYLVGYMYRETPIEKEDSGWRFFSGTEDEEFLDDENNIEIYEVNTIANLDK